MLGLLVVVACCCPGLASAQEGKRPDPDAALRLAFPDCQLQRVSRTLDAKQLALAGELAGAPIERATVFAYEARRDGVLVGTAYFDRHPVRTKQEVLLIVVDPAGRARRVEVLAFGEPPEYQPREVFYAQFTGRPLDGELRSKKAIRTIAGATLTVEATIAAVRRVLAVHTVTAPRPQPAANRAPGAQQGTEPAPSPVRPPEPGPGTAGGGRA